MRVSVDRESDALYFRLDESRIMESEEVRPGVILDYDDQNRVRTAWVSSSNGRPARPESSPETSITR